MKGILVMMCLLDKAHYAYQMNAYFIVKTTFCRKHLLFPKLHGLCKVSLNNIEREFCK